MGALLTELGLPFFDVVTSDIAPNLTGIRDVDDAHVADLFLAVVRVVTEGLRKGGNYVVKVFFSPGFRDMARDLRPLFFQGSSFQTKGVEGGERRSTSSARGVSLKKRLFRFLSRSPEFIPLTDRLHLFLRYA